MISSKKARSTSVTVFAFSSAVLVSGCSWLKIDSVTDTVNYRGNSGSIANLEIPPGLTAPAFDSTYTIQRPVSASDVPPPTQTAIAVGQSGGGIPTGMGGLNSTLSSLKDGNPVLAVEGRYDQVWAKTGQSLGRMGLTIASQQYEQGIYTVIAANTVDEDKNVVSRFMSYLNSKIGDGKATEGVRYRFIIGDRGEQSLIVVSDEAGKPVNVEEASALLARLKTELSQ